MTKGGKKNKNSRAKKIKKEYISMEVLDFSGDSDEQQESSGESENESSIRRRDGGITAVRQRHQRSGSVISDRTVAKKGLEASGRKSSAWSQIGSSLSQFTDEAWIMVKPTWQLAKWSRWVFAPYILWLGLTYLYSHLYSSVTTTMAPVCALPIIGPRIPFCASSLQPNNGSIDVSKMATSQEALTDVMDSLGQGLDLARDMNHHEYVIRDLRIAVANSKLPRKKEITQKLGLLIQYTQEYAKGLSGLTAKGGSAIDSANSFNTYAVDRLQDIDDRQRNRQPLLDLVRLLVDPFAVLGPLDTDLSEKDEKKVRDVFITTANGISGKLHSLASDCFNLGHRGENIQRALDRIKELAISDLDGLPQMAPLGALWKKVANPDGYQQYQSHSALLNSLNGMYKNASYVMEQTGSALNTVEAEMKEFRDDFATPGLIMQDFPIKLIVEQFQKASLRLEAGLAMFRRVEAGEPKQGISTRTATLLVD